MVRERFSISTLDESLRDVLRGAKRVSGAHGTIYLFPFEASPSGPSIAGSPVSFEGVHRFTRTDCGELQIRSYTYEQLVGKHLVGESNDAPPMHIAYGPKMRDSLLGWIGLLNDSDDLGSYVTTVFAPSATPPRPQRSDDEIGDFCQSLYDQHFASLYLLSMPHILQ